MHRRMFLFTGSAALVTACAKPTIPLASGAAPSENILVATTRQINPQTNWPTNLSSPGLGWLNIPITYPQNLSNTLIEPEDLKRGKPVLIPTRAAFQEQLRTSKRTRNTKEALLFVHGYNNSFDSSVTRATQMIKTFEANTVPVHYAWSSAGAPLAYIGDTDSMLIARDGLEQTLADLHKTGLNTIILAHSMGCNLVMETLRQMAIAKNPAMKAIRGVFLVAPDIDVTLFQTQLNRIPVLPQPFLVLTNQRDRALALSRGLRGFGGSRERLGTLGDGAVLADYNITLIDATAITTRNDHFPVANSPALAALLNKFGQVPGAFEDPTQVNDLLTGTVIGIRSLTQVVLDPSLL